MEQAIALLIEVVARMDALDTMMSVNVRFTDEDDVKKMLEHMTAIRQSLRAIEAGLPAKEIPTNE